MKYPPEVWKTSKHDNIGLRSCIIVYNQNIRDIRTKRCIIPFPKKSDLGIPKNYRAAKIYNTLLLNGIQPEIEKILRKIPKWLSEKSISEITNFDYPSKLGRCSCKKTWCDTFICTILKDIWHSHRGNMEQILFANDFLKETVAAIMMLHKNSKVKVHSPDGDTDFYEIVAGVVQADTLTPYQFINCLDYVLRTSIDLMKENIFRWRRQEADDTLHIG